MKLLKLFLGLHIAAASLVTSLLLASNTTWCIASMAYLTLAMLSYHSLRKLARIPKPQQNRPEPTPERPAEERQLDPQVIRGLIKKGFTPSLIERLVREGRLSVNG
jgi:hypothetical protein